MRPREPRPKVSRYYVCMGSVRFGASACSQASLRADDLERLVFAYLEHLHDQAGSVAQLRAAIEASNSDTRALRGDAERALMKAQASYDELIAEWDDLTISNADYAEAQPRRLAKLEAAQATLDQIAAREQENAAEIAALDTAEQEVVERIRAVQEAVSGDIASVADDVRAVNATPPGGLQDRQPREREGDDHTVAPQRRLGLSQRGRGQVQSQTRRVPAQGKR